MGLRNLSSIPWVLYLEMYGNCSTNLSQANVGNSTHHYHHQISNRLNINANISAVMLIGKPSQIQDDADIKINDIRIEQVQPMEYLGIYLNNILSWDVQCDKLCANVAGKISVLCKIRPFCRPNTLILLYEKTIQPVFIMSVLFGVTQSKAASQGYNVLETTLLELLLATSITLILEVLSYCMNSTGHQLKKDAITLQQQ